VYNGRYTSTESTDSVVAAAFVAMGGLDIKIKSLSNDSYAHWRARIKWVLQHQDAWKAIDDPTNATAEQVTKALVTIGLNVDDQFIPMVEKAKTASEVWKSLEAMFNAKTNARRLQLRRQLSSFKKEASEGLTEYATRAKTLQDDLAAIGHPVSDDEVVCSILA
jgi:hypothetical protein